MEPSTPYSAAFTPQAITALRAISPLEDLTAEWAWGGSTGSGVKVAVIDSGIDADHPAIGTVDGYVSVVETATGLTYDTEPARGCVRARHGLRGHHSVAGTRVPSCSASGCSTRGWAVAATSSAPACAGQSTMGCRCAT